MTGPETAHQGKNLTHKNWIRSPAERLLPCPAQHYCGEPFVQDDFLLVCFLPHTDSNNTIMLVVRRKDDLFLLSSLGFFRVSLLPLRYVYFFL